MRGEWVRQPNEDAVVVFVHGILSSGESCWRHDNGAYWPELLKNESAANGWGIYVYSYQTGFFSGTYSLNDVVDDLKERFLNLDHLAKHRRIVFICHSMGGIVARKFLVERVNDLLDRNIEVGLFLVASPSMGSDYANWLAPLAKLLGHTQADALRFTRQNSWLNGLDKEFRNLKESGRLTLNGKELIEDKFVVLKRWFGKQVVEPFSGARYFGEPYKVPGSDHFTIAKPAYAQSDQHRLLLAFLEKLPKPSAAVPSQYLADKELDFYCQTAESLHAKLPLAGFKTKLRVPIDLEQLYVPLQAVVDLRATGDCRFADAEEALEKLHGQGSQEISLIEAFREMEKRKRRGIVILGDPGSGKTTHLKRLLLACLREGPISLGVSADLLPVFLPLRELDDLSSGIDAFIEKTLASPHLKMSEGFGARLLARGRLLLLFDGLDEVVDPAHRAKVSHWIEQAMHVRLDCIGVVTCRFAGYDDVVRLNSQFLELHLRPLTLEQAQAFIRQWYWAVETGLSADLEQGQIDADRRSGELIERLQAPDFRSARMASMTRNPLLLANLCLVHRDRGALPRGRHQLYDESIEVLLERWRESKNLLVSVSAETGRRVLQPVALYLHQEAGRTRASAQELAPVMEPILKTKQWPGGDAFAFLRTVRDESGLLTGWGPDHFGFMHLGFQEYLAACEIRRLAFEGDKAASMQELAGHFHDSWWQEVILLLLAQGNPSLFEPFIRAALQQPKFDGAMDVFSLILEEGAEVTATPFIEVVKQLPGKDPKTLERSLMALQILGQLLSKDELNPLLELVGAYLPHSFVNFFHELVPISAITTRFTENGKVELLYITGGRFRMGSSDGQGFDAERPEHEVEVKPFYLGRYPVTNEEYDSFLQTNPDIPEPAYWGDRRFNQARQPVVGVSWNEACRFAEWAGGRLPTEAEWEYACRTGTSTAYWWGDEIGNNRANGAGSSIQWGGRRTSPVGSFPPNNFGLYDMHGNVWEWCQDHWHENYQGAPVNGKAWEDADGGRRVIRGGSWFYRPVYLRAANRNWYIPEDLNGDLGFRLAQDP